MGSSTDRDVVVLTAREPSAQRDRALAHALTRAPDWERVIALASAHGVLPLLAATLSDEPFRTDVPLTVVHGVQTIAAASGLRTRALLSTLMRVLQAMQARGIEPLVLKGPALACALYADPALRPFGDLDLLCRPDQLAEAHAVLRQLGFEALYQKPTEVEGFHTVFQSPAGSILIELHRDLLQLGLPTRCLSDLWQAPMTFHVGAVPARMLQLQHQVLHLCVHVHLHGYTRLIWFKDLDLLLRRHGQMIDWALVRELARDEGAALSLRHSLALLAALLETPVPADALHGLPYDPLGETAHALLWPRKRVLRLRSKQRLRSLRFNPRMLPLGVIPSLVVMGRRREKLMRLLRPERVKPRHGSDPGGPNPQVAPQISPPTPASEKPSGPLLSQSGDAGPQAGSTA